MKRFISALVFCFSLLVLLTVFLFPPVEAKENVLLSLLNLPAPPPPNPLVAAAGRPRDDKFFNKSNPPGDNASINDLLDYWSSLSSSRQPLRYSPEMSDKVRERIMREIDKNPKLLTNYLSVLKDDPKSGDFVKELYDREGSGGAFSKDERRTIKEWLTFNSPHFSSDLARIASTVSDTGEYVTSQEELLALTRVDFDKAQPIIELLNADSSLKTSRVLAKWALYRHALDTNSTGDIERYRDELKEIVEDKSALPGMRDLAMDALAGEKEWAGRDDWYFSLLGDETLAELRVNGSVNTGLTTLILVSPDEKYVAKMIELAQSDNVWIRTAAVRNLVTRLESGGPDVVKALLPWLEDPKWAGDADSSRQTLIRKLSEYAIPESVPGLIKVLDEKQKNIMPYYGANSANMAANSMKPASNRIAVNSVSNSSLAANVPVIKDGVEVTSYPHRYMAVLALTKQKDGRAVPALRRILPEGESYERSNVVGAILASGGFSVPEQLAALETSAKGISDQIAAEEAAAAAEPLGAIANAYPYPYPYTSTNANTGPPPKRPPTAAEISAMLGEQLLRSTEISDELARGIVDRIEFFETRDARMASAYRRMILRWQNAAINILLLRDVKRGIADTDTVVRLLSQRKELREKQSSDVSDLRTGKPMAVGIAACLLEDASDYAAILENANAETKTALLACARLIRAPLPVAEVAKNLKLTPEILVTAAERYLESEDSLEARSIVLARHPNEARILGATSAFFVADAGASYNSQLWALYQSIGNEALYNGWSGSGNDDELKKIEKQLKEEVIDDEKLTGVYAYDRHYIRIFSDRAIFSWDEDDSRYRERPLTKYEFDEIKSYLATNRVDELPPFLSCGGEYCSAKELVMLGKNGGRRVYMNGEPGDFFLGLDRYFAALKQTPATLKYTLSREIPGLELLLASDELHAETVWKNGGDLRIAASDTAVRKKIKEEIEDAETGESVDETDESQGSREKLVEKRRFDGFAWYSVVDGAASPAAQPAEIEFIPVRDNLTGAASAKQWKARAPGVEIRTSPEGLFKVARGKLTRLHEGFYDNAVVSPNGRWAIVNKFDENKGTVVVRVNLLNNREFPVEIEGYGEFVPTAYIATLGKVLVVRRYYEHEYGGEDDDTVPADDDPEGMFLIDPPTGVVQPIAGEFRPLSQQTFRPLQKASKPNEFWAAVSDPETHATEVGIYDTRNFGFEPMLRIPKIAFNSMSMWVDESENKVYFVYRGHLLSLPLGKG